MMTCSEINRLVKQGVTVLAKVPGFDDEQSVLKARVAYKDQLQVLIRAGGEKVWRTVNWSAVQVPETVEAEQ